MLRLDLRVGESVRIGDATVTIEEKSGQVARLAIEADKAVPIERVQPSSMADVVKGGLAPMPV